MPIFIFKTSFHLYLNNFLPTILSKTAINCNTYWQRFREHSRRMKKPKPIDTFLYQHFKLTGHSPNDVLVQPVEKLSYEKILHRDSKSLKDTKLN